ncbi:FMN-dependent NADH-azoreductase [Paraburkholderia oxyphila]|uniref:FMN-dependent NADH-azoreductase n=1 Tax=Paraburkholderia oxyphila TaxID=614212 RepID=UPI000AC0887C|nr:NAD(P)H-dependent oxidoreductase [Paraburkholderia oxyphila]
MQLERIDGGIRHPPPLHDIEYIMQILRIDSSPQVPSVSRQLSGELVAELTRHEPGCQVVHRDLGKEPLAHLSHQSVVSIRTPETSTPEQKAVRVLSDSLIDELEAADLLVIGSPMYNFGITSQLKVWFDHVLRAGRTFHYTPEGPIGLLSGKRAVLVMTRGGVHSSGPARLRDHQEPHLRTLLAFIGIGNVSVILAEGLGMGAESQQRGLASARSAIGRWVADETQQRVSGSAAPSRA